MVKVLLIDDDVELSELLAELLQYEDFQLSAVHNGVDGLAMAQRGDFSLVLLDVMLPGLNGFQLLRRLRETSQVPVIMLTARGEPADRVMGLEHGADDYLPKPFTEAELIARMKAVMRRYQVSNPKNVANEEGYESEGLSLSFSQQTACWHERDLELTSTELAILTELLAGAGRPVNKKQLSEKALGRKLLPFDRSVDMHVSHLRKKLAAYVEPVPIKTIRGKGYIWTAAVVRAL